MKRNNKKNNEQHNDILEFSQDIPKNTKKTIKRLMKRLGTQYKKLLIVGISVLISSAAYATMPLMIGEAIDNLVNVIRNFDDSTSILSTVTNVLAMPILILVVLSIANTLLTYMQQYIIASVGENLTLSLRKDISEKINKLPLSYFDSHKTGEIMSRVTNDLEKVSLVMQVGFMQFITSCLTIIFTIIAMFVLNTFIIRLPEYTSSIFPLNAPIAAKFSA